MNHECEFIVVGLTVLFFLLIGSTQLLLRRKGSKKIKSGNMIIFDRFDFKKYMWESIDRLKKWGKGDGDLQG